MRQAQSLKARASSNKAMMRKEGSSPARQMMETLSREGQRLADTIDPELLTGLGLGGYSEPLYDLMDRLMVAPTVTKFLFFNKVQGLESLARRMVEDRELARQMNELVWSAGLAIEDLSQSPRAGRVGGQGPRQALPAAMRRRAQPPIPTARTQAWPPSPAHVNVKPLPLMTTQRLIPPFKQGVGSASSTSPSAVASPRVRDEDHPLLLVNVADRRRIEAEVRQEALKERFDELMETRRVMAEAVREASMMPPEQIAASYYDVAPTAEEEAKVIDSLAQVTVALHQDVLKRARAREKAELSGVSTDAPAPFCAWAAPASTSLTATGLHYPQIQPGSQGVRIVARSGREALEIAGKTSSASAVGAPSPISVLLREERSEQGGKSSGIRAPLKAQPLG
jgi:hypothetical protein